MVVGPGERPLLACLPERQAAQADRVEGTGVLYMGDRTVGVIATAGDRQHDWGFDNRRAVLGGRG